MRSLVTFLCGVVWYHVFNPSYLLTTSEGEARWIKNLQPFGNVFHIKNLTTATRTRIFCLMGILMMVFLENPGLVWFPSGRSRSPTVHHRPSFAHEGGLWCLQFKQSFPYFQAILLPRRESFGRDTSKAFAIMALRPLKNTMKTFFTFLSFRDLRWICITILPLAFSLIQYRRLRRRFSVSGAPSAAPYVATPGIRDYLGYGGHGLLVFDIMISTARAAFPRRVFMMDAQQTS